MRTRLTSKNRYSKDCVVYRYKMRLCILLTLLFTSVLSETTNDVQSRLVLINSGPVRGYKDPQEDVFVFYGIPYAKAPTGAQRFKAPLPAPVWFDILEAVDKDIVCPQTIVMDLLPKTKHMKEDCLIANVYVPETEGKNLPVVVYVHGGGFVLGFGDLVTPKKLVSNKKIIVVTFNYRLGAHGFLCLGTEDIPGNAGMKDQVALLRWVKKNIASFGGNAKDVTIAGYSAGSSSVDILMISKMAEGLFNKVIPESGASISPFSIQIDPIDNAKEYARLIGHNNVEDISELENYYKEASYEILQSGNILYLKDFTVLVAPCVERDIGQEMFLRDNPVNILKQGNYARVPMLYGFAELEGLMRIPVFNSWQKEMNENFSNFLPADLHFKNQEEKELVADMIKKQYFGYKPVDNNTILEFVEYVSDVTFGCPTLRVVNHLVKAGHSEIYLYQYSYTDENTPVVPNTNVRGANHCDQTNIVLDGINSTLNRESIFSKDYLNMQNMMRELWGNFIRYRKPTASGTPEWPPVGKDWSPHMVLKKNSKLKGSLLKEKCSFWDKIYNLYYKFPVPPLASPLKHSEL